MRAVIPLLLVSLFAGCAAPAQEPDPRLDPVAVAPRVFDVATCDNCFEPSVATLPSGKLAVLAGGLVILDPTTNTTEERALPPVPSPALPGSRSLGDGLVQTSPEGRLYYSNMVLGPQGRFVGAHVAASDDDGATWAVNTFVPSTPGPTGVAGIDRQWLGFGADDVVYVSWAQQDIVFVAGFAGGAATGLWIARSDNGGASFAQPVRAAPYEDRQRFGQAGAPIVDADGRVLLPYLAGGCSTPGCIAPSAQPSVRIAVSTDDGATWAQETIWEEFAAGFPTLALDSDGVLAAFWSGEALLVAREEGDAWSEPVRWSDASSFGYHGAALLPREGGLDVATFEAREEACDLVLARGEPTARLVLAEGLEPMFGRACPSDFASAARMPDGRIAIVWGDPAASVTRVAIV